MKRYDDMIDHHSYTQLIQLKIRAWKKFRPERYSNLHDTGAVLYRLSYQAICELVTLWVLLLLWNTAYYALY